MQKMLILAVNFVTLTRKNMCIKVAIFLMLYTYNYLRIPCILAVYRQYVYNFSGRLGYIGFNLIPYTPYTTLQLM